MTNTAQQNRDIASARFIVRCLNNIKQDEAMLQELPSPQPSSALWDGEQTLPELSIAAFVQSKLAVAYGHITVLAKVLGLDPGDEISELDAPPYGCFELIRTAMECAAHALWVIGPHDNRQRLERRLFSEADEIENVEKYLKASKSKNMQQIKDKKFRLKGYSRRLDDDFTPWKVTDDGREVSKIGIANMISQVQDFRDPNALGGFETAVSWSAIWRACSGAAHGSAWAMTLLNKLEPIEGTREGFSQNQNVHPNYNAIKYALFGASEILASALDRFVDVSINPAKQ